MSTQTIALFDHSNPRMLIPHMTWLHVAGLEDQGILAQFTEKDNDAYLGWWREHVKDAEKGKYLIFVSLDPLAPLNPSVKGVLLADMPPGSGSARCEISILAVDKAARRRGIAKSLIEAAGEEAWRRQRKTLVSLLGSSKRQGLTYTCRWRVLERPPMLRQCSAACHSMRRARSQTLRKMARRR